LKSIYTNHISGMDVGADIEVNYHL